MEEKVVVYLIRDGHHSDQRDKLRSLFKSEHFILIVPNIPLEENRHYHSNEAYQIGWCLSDCRENYKENSCIILKDSCKCVAKKKFIYEIVYGALNNDKSFDVCYLSKYMDKCHLYSNRRKIVKTPFGLAKTSSPHGAEALLFTRNGRDVILGIKPMKNGEFFKPRETFEKSLHYNISKGYVDAFCVFPNLFFFDISLSTSNQDYIKVNECEDIQNSLTTKNKTCTINIYVATIIIIILFILIVWAAICVSPSGFSET